MCVLLLLGRVFCACEIKVVHIVVQIFYILADFYLLLPSIIKKGVLKFLTMIVYLSIAPFSFVSVLIMYFEADI